MNVGHLEWESVSTEEFWELSRELHWKAAGIATCFCLSVNIMVPTLRRVFSKAQLPTQCKNQMSISFYINLNIPKVKQSKNFGPYQDADHPTTRCTLPDQPNFQAALSKSFNNDRNICPESWIKWARSRILRSYLGPKIIPIPKHSYKLILWVQTAPFSMLSMVPVT